MIENVLSMTRPLSEKPASSFPPWHGSIEYNLFAQHARISSLVKKPLFSPSKLSPIELKLSFPGRYRVSPINGYIINDIYLFSLARPRSF